MIGQVTVNIKEIYIQAEWHHSFGKGDVASMVLSTVKKKTNLPEVNPVPSLSRSFNGCCCSPF